MNQNNIETPNENNVLKNNENTQIGSSSLEETTNIIEKKEKLRKNKVAIISLVVIILVIAIICIILILGGKIKFDSKNLESNKIIENTDEPANNTLKDEETGTISPEKLDNENTGGVDKLDISILKLNNEEKDVVYSPLSIKYTLSMLSDAADGKSKKQIDDLLGDFESKKYTNNTNIALTNALFVKNSYKNYIKSDYISYIQNKYNASTIYDDFQNASTINAWIKNNTLNLLDNVVTDDEIEGSDFAFVNALAINMEWNYQLRNIYNSGNVKGLKYSVSFAHELYTDWLYDLFNYNEIEKNTFNNKTEVVSPTIKASVNKYDIVTELGYDNIRSEVEKEYREYLKNPECSEDTSEEAIQKYLDTYMDEINSNYNQIYKSTDFSFYKDSEVTVFAKNLKTYDNISLQYIGIMPNNETLSSFIDNVDSDKLNEIISNLKSLNSLDYGKVYKINGSIPLFKNEYKINLIDNLKSLGVTDIFEKENSDLSNMATSNETYIDMIIQKSNIEFSNDGIKASAAALSGGDGAASCGFDKKYEVPVEEIDLTFDKPYMYLIRNRENGDVWFVGSVYNPLETIDITENNE